MIRTIISLLLSLACVVSAQAATDPYKKNNRSPNNTLRVTPITPGTGNPGDQNRPGSIPYPDRSPSHGNKCDEDPTLIICNTAQPSRNGQHEQMPTAPKRINPAAGENHPPYRFQHTAPSLNLPYEPGQILLFFIKADTVQLRIQQIEQKFQLKPVKRVKLEALGGEIIQYQTDKDLTQLKRQLNQIAPEAIIDFNMYYFSQAGPRQYFASQINLLNNPPPTKTASVAVGIIDTDISQVPALQSSTISRKSFLPALAKAASTKHGTAVALLIAGHDQANGFQGVAPAAPLYIASIMRKSAALNNTNTVLLAQAIDWLVAEKVQIINLSLGGPGDAIMQRLFKNLRDLPILLIAAAGNNGPNAPPSYPAAYSNVIAVTATNANQQIYKHANQGDYIDIAAPGEDVWVPLDKQGQYMSGTSFSAALVTGAICRLMSGNKVKDSTYIKESLFQQTLDLGKPGQDTVFGRGLLQLN